MAEYVKGLTPQQETALWHEVCGMLRSDLIWAAVEEVANNYVLTLLPDEEDAEAIAAASAVTSAAAAADAAADALRDATLAAAVAARVHRDALDAYAAALAVFEK
jgi:hypothetical protein